jgi:hypothetical protein
MALYCYHICPAWYFTYPIVRLWKPPSTTNHSAVIVSPPPLLPPAVSLVEQIFFCSHPLRLLTLANQLCRVPICGQIVAPSSHSAFPSISFNFPFCSVLLLVSDFAARSSSTMRKFWGPFEHNFTSRVSVFYFLSPRLILSYYSLPSPFVWSFSFNIPSRSFTPPSSAHPTALVNYSTLPNGRGEDRVQ